MCSALRVLKVIQQTTITMKAAAVFALALVCIVGLATAQYYPSYYPQESTGGFGQLLPLLLLLLVFPFLFNSSSSGSTTFIYGNFSGPTGGK